MACKRGPSLREASSLAQRALSVDKRQGGRTIISFFHYSTILLFIFLYYFTSIILHFCIRILRNPIGSAVGQVGFRFVIGEVLVGWGLGQWCKQMQRSSHGSQFRVSGLGFRV